MKSSSNSRGRKAGSRSRASSNDPAANVVRADRADGAGEAVAEPAGADGASILAAPEPDIDEAKAAHGRLGQALAALDARLLTRVVIDAQGVGLVALGVDARLRDPKRAATIAALAKLGLARAEDIAGLADAALAAWYTRHKLLEAAGTASKAVLSADLRDEAKACRTRMRSSLEYNVPKKQTKAWELLDHYRAGSGDMDLANDLDGYAGMYTAPCLQYIVGDRTNYRAGDRALAKKLAAKVRGRLSSADPSEVRTWSDAQQRALTLCKARYDEAARVGRFIDRDDAGEYYPNLVSAVRAAPTRKPNGAPKPPAGGAPPA
jgi:hypothetical protein